VSRQHDRATGGNLGDVVDENDSQLLEALDDQLVVNDLVVAVHRRRKTPHHPRQGLDRHLDTGAETARCREQHAIDRHAVRITRPVEGRR